jgi:hypothetical protein
MQIDPFLAAVFVRGLVWVFCTCDERTPVLQNPDAAFPYKDTLMPRAPTTQQQQQSMLYERALIHTLTKT